MRRLPLIAGLVVSFALPYLVVSLLASRRDAQWSATGLTAHEIREWREFGFSDPGEAMRWRNVGFRAPAASIWKEGGWSDAAAAFGFHEADFGVREARRWHEERFDAAAARAWRAAGFYVAADARRWREAGELPSDAALKRKNGLQPGESRGRHER